jgi:hypothetical protein
MTIALTHLKPILLAVALTASGAPSPSGTLADRAAVEQVLRTLEVALAERNLDGAAAVYDAENVQLVSRIKGEVKGWLALNDAHVTYRLGSVTGGRGKSEAVVLRSVTFREHDREQVDLQWETVRLRPHGSSWRIASEDERSFARTANTDLRIELFPQSGSLRGASTLKVEVTAQGEDSLLLELNRGLEVISLTEADGRPVAFQRAATSIVIPRARPLTSGEVLTLRIAFEGKLFNEAKENGYSQVSIAPAGSFASWVTSWYPRVSGTGSKSTGKILFDVPNDNIVASSGRLASTVTMGDRSRQVFTVDRPLDFSFAAAKYFHREETVGGVRLGVYFLRGGDAKADLYLRNAARTLRYEQQLFGAYPFDGYALVEVPSDETGTLEGSSEQGMNLFPAGVLPDNDFPLLLLAHEMGHGWWGNLVSSASGPIIDEGLAQMSAVMSLEQFEGAGAMRSFLKNGAPTYSQSAAQYFRFASSGDDYPLGSLQAGSDARAALHDLADTKGMFVYQMLRETIGHQAFVRGLQSIVLHFAGKAASLGNLRTAWETASGRDLSGFFHEWFERTGAAALTLDWKVAPADEGFLVTGTITQQGDLYDVDTDVALVYPGRHEMRRVHVSAASTPFSFRTSQRPSGVVLDPEYRILRWIAEFRQLPLLAEGMGLCSLGRRAEAVARLEEYIHRAPEALQGRYQLGLCYQEANNLPDAERSFRVVLDGYASLGVYEPAVALSQLHLGQVLDLAGRRDDALVAYRKTLELPDEALTHQEARAGLAAAYVSRPRATGPGREVLAHYAGNYDSQTGIAFRFALNDQGLLTVVSTGLPDFSLVWLEGARFSTPGLPGRIEFPLAFVGSPEVTGLDATVSGRVVHLQRTK